MSSSRARALARGEPGRSYPRHARRRAPRFRRRAERGLSRAGGKPWRDIHKFDLGRKGLNPFRDLLMTRGFAHHPPHPARHGLHLYGQARDLGHAAGAACRRETKLCDDHRPRRGLCRTGDAEGPVVAGRRRATLSHGAAGSTRIFFRTRTIFRFCRSAFLPDRRKAVHVMGSGVNMAHYPRQPLPGARPSFFFIGRMIEDKGIADFCGAARQWCARFRKRASSRSARTTPIF